VQQNNKLANKTIIPYRALINNFKPFVAIATVIHGNHRLISNNELNSVVTELDINHGS